MSRATLRDWLAEAERDGASPALTGVIETLAEAVIELAAALRTAALDGYAGAVETQNVHGETQKALDVLANDIFIARLKANAAVGALASEEEDELIDLKRSRAGFGVSFDPLDGSSNADVNMTIGSIFSVHAIDAAAPNLMKRGREQLAAGYAAYGPATTLVVTFGKSAALFQLAGAGTFRLVDPALSVPRHSAEFAINTSRAPLWDEVIRSYIDERVAGKGGPFGEASNMRWTASMVADVQRILKRGGVFLYPADSATQKLGGRLRLLYEAAPIALIVEAAGGAASTGHLSLLDVEPTALHQKVPVILGSADDVAVLTARYAARSS